MRTASIYRVGEGFAMTYQYDDGRWNSELHRADGSTIDLRIYKTEESALKMAQKRLGDGVELLGTSIEAIKKAEDRELFKETMPLLRLAIHSRVAHGVQAGAVGAQDQSSGRRPRGMGQGPHLLRGGHRGGRVASL